MEQRGPPPEPRVRVDRSRLAAKKKRTRVEWVGGLVSLPGYALAEGEPFQPEVLFWIGAEGAVLGMVMGRPGELLGKASESLQHAIAAPMFGIAHAPARVRVSSPELADVLRVGHPSIEFVCAPTPELDEVVATVTEKMAEDAEVRRSYLSPGVGPEAISSLFRAAAGLFRAAPWKVVPSSESLLSVTIQAFELRDAVLSVIGQMGQNLGILVFSSIADFDAYLAVADAVEFGEEEPLPPHVALSFERAAELAGGLRNEIAAHHWEVAGPEAYPWLAVVDEDLEPRSPTGKVVAILEAIALALSQVSEEPVLRSAWSGGEPFSRGVTVRTHAGELEVTLRAPYEPAYAESELPDDLLAALAALAQEGELAPDARGPLEDELVRRFSAAPEAATLGGVAWCHYLMSAAADHLGETIATLDGPALEEILFEVIPRKASVDASAAPSIIEELRAFYGFLKRELGLAQADKCLEILGGDAVIELEAALSDSRNFGMAKSLVMAGRQAGYDMSTKAGIEAWMRTMAGRPLPGSPQPRPGRPPHATTAVAARAKKNQRKAARKARKRNR